MNMFHSVALAVNICRTFIVHSGYFYSASSSLLLLRGAARILCRSFTPKRHRQLRVKVLPKVPTWRLERDSNPRPFGRKASTIPMSHHVPLEACSLCSASEDHCGQNSRDSSSPHRMPLNLCGPSLSPHLSPSSKLFLLSVFSH